MNHIMIAGHLGADPEVRFTSSGQKVTTIRVACRSRKGAKEETIWWKVTMWGDQFDKMMPYFKKGSSIMVMGELSKPEIFNDREGKPQISLNITASTISFSPFGKPERSENENSGSHNTQYQEAPSYQPSQTMTGQSHAFAPTDDEEIPF